MPVYIVEAEGLKRVKIGASKDADKRISALQSACPVKLILRALIPGYRTEEKFIHQKFKKDRLHGEWFKLSKKLKKFIKQYDVADDETWEKLNKWERAQAAQRLARQKEIASTCDFDFNEYHNVVMHRPDKGPITLDCPYGERFKATIDKFSSEIVLAPTMRTKRTKSKKSFYSVILGRKPYVVSRSGYQVTLGNIWRAPNANSKLYALISGIQHEKSYGPYPLIDVLHNIVETFEAMKGDDAVDPWRVKLRKNQRYSNPFRGIENRFDNDDDFQRFYNTGMLGDFLYGYMKPYIESINKTVTIIRHLRENEP